MYWKDPHGRYAGCNTAYLTFRGLTEAGEILGRDEPGIARDDAIRVTLDDLEARVTASGEPIIDHKVDVPDHDGQVRSLLLSVLPIEVRAPGIPARGVIGVGADITHASALERQLAQANRLESIGQLAAGIAHEINTPIQFVTDNTQFVTESTAQMLAALTEIHEAAGLEQTDDSTLCARSRRAIEGLDLDFLREEVPGALRDSREGLRRVGQIVRAMKDYAHPGLSLADVDINRAIESTIQVCRNEWKYVAKVELDLDPHAGVVPAYEGELKQVVLNMVVNAAQAIADDPRPRTDTPLGLIRISTRRTGIDFVITIADDGPGMTPQVRDRVFNPFFTTKQVGKGTGQGLSLAHAVIVTKHRGRIDLATAPGQGATFTLHLPLEADIGAELSDPAPSAGPHEHGTDTPR